MTIKESNLQLLNNLENQLREYATWIAKNGLTITHKTIEQYRDLRKFTISLSAAMVGIVFPLLFVSEILEEATLQTPQIEYFQKGGKQGIHSEHMGYILTELQYMQRTYPNMTW